MSKANRHRAEVIEVYDNGSAAVRFKWRGRERVEHVIKRGDVPNFTVAMRGIVDFVYTGHSGEWVFTPAKG